MKNSGDAGSQPAPGDLASRNPYRYSTPPLPRAPDSSLPRTIIPPFLHALPTGVSTAWTTRTRGDDPKETRDTPDVGEKESRGKDREDGWATCLRVMTDYDRNMVKAWKEDIDGLLLLAGLFSGVVTAFSIESYGMLQPDPTATSTSLVAQISLQLAALTPKTSLPISNLQDLISPPDFVPTPLAVSVNTLWFLSLSLSLLAALAGLLVRQWLRAYSAPARASVRARVRVRQARHAALLRWRVPLIVSLLPLLLQTAVVLFLAGLVLLLWSLDSVVAGTVSTLLTLALLGFVAEVLAPAFVQDCPYHSPSSDNIVGAVSALKSIRWPCRGRRRRGPRLHDEEIQTAHILKRGIRTEPVVEEAALDKAAIAWTQQLISGYELAAPLMDCLADLDREAVFTWVAQERGVSLSRLLDSVRGQMPWPSDTGTSGDGDERVLSAVLDALADNTVETGEHAISRMDVTGLLAHLADEVAHPTSVFSRRCFNELLPILEEMEILPSHARLFSKLFLRIVEGKQQDLSHADVELLALWALRMFRRLGSLPNWTTSDERTFEHAVGAALTALVFLNVGAGTLPIRERARALLVALRAFFTHTSLPTPGVPWFGVLRALLDSVEGGTSAGEIPTALPSDELGDALEALVALHRARWAETWMGRASWGGEMQYEVLERMTSATGARGGTADALAHAEEGMEMEVEVEAASLFDSASTWTAIANRH